MKLDRITDKMIIIALAAITIAVSYFKPPYAETISTICVSGLLSLSGLNIKKSQNN